jgi:uncharacterized membrane protein
MVITPSIARHTWIFAPVVAALAWGGGAPVRAAELRFLETGPSAFSPRAAYDVSSDGSVVVGGGRDPDSPLIGFRWTEAEGSERIGPVPGATLMQAYTVSGDGNVIFGDRERDSGIPGAQSAEVFRWTRAGGLVPLGGRPPRALQAHVARSNHDGSVAVGWYWEPAGDSFRQWAVRWTPAGEQDLPSIPGHNSEANDVSDDGSVIVGASGTGAYFRAVRWTGAGIEPIAPAPTPGDYNTRSVAMAVSGNGRVISGYLGIGAEAFRWTASEGLVGLGPMPGVFWPQSIDEDGSIIVGTGTDRDGYVQALIWDADHGVRPLQTVLEGLGVDTQGITLNTASAVSADGRTIVGWDYQRGAYVAVIPEPAGLAALASTALATLRVRRRPGGLNSDDPPRGRPIREAPARDTTVHSLRARASRRWCGMLRGADDAGHAGRVRAPCVGADRRG